MSGPSLTTRQYQAIIKKCRELFVAKTRDYGTAWRILRLPSLTDQIYIKANRIRSIQDKGVQKIDESIAGEFIAIVNYCVMANIQSQLTEADGLELPVEKAVALYDAEVAKTASLQLDKNHDYGEAWRSMRVSSMTDIILMKLFRIKQIEDNAGATLVSEGVDANYRDIMNYAIFCLIQMGEADSGN